MWPRHLSSQRESIPLRVASQTASVSIKFPFSSTSPRFDPVDSFIKWLLAGSVKPLRVRVAGTRLLTGVSRRRIFSARFAKLLTGVSRGPERAGPKAKMITSAAFGGLKGSLKITKHVQANSPADVQDQNLQNAAMK